jgi:eukaryotic-like serine/threonine-protein kinase
LAVTPFLDRSPLTRGWRSSAAAVPVHNLREQLQVTLGGDYSIERELGGGGMSRVFVARDLGLGRDVVVKVIAPENAEGMSAERFAREVRLAARLQQANIVPVLSAGTSGALPYYTMPFVRGESLRARLATGVPLAITDAVSILRDVARALAYAHADGVVHRDIKPENILLSGGAAVVTDFGIAKAIDESRTHDGMSITSITSITRAGMSLGTPAYMAPEQALGDPTTDYRADIYAWGVVAWELLGGEHPFARHTTMQALIAAHITEPAASLAKRRPELPDALARLVMRCMEKQPANRPSSATELLDAIQSVSMSGEGAPAPARSRRRLTPRQIVTGVIAAVAIFASVIAFRSSRWGAGASPSGTSLAILPFVVAGGDTANVYLGEGIAEEVSNTLSQIPGLRLAGRSSAARLARSGRLSAQDIAKSLGVGAVLDGTVRRIGDHVRVTVELTNGADGSLIWRESYDRAASDIMAMQDGIARAIAGQLQFTLAATDPGATGGTNDAAAHDLYLRAMYLYHRRGTGLIEAVSDFEQATARDSNFARAWAGLSAALIVEGNYVDAPIRNVLPRARQAAERAVRLAPMLSEAHLALGYVQAESFEWDAAEKELRRAIDLDPTAAEPRYRLGYLMKNMRRQAEAIPVLQQAKARDPMYFITSCYLGAAEVDVGAITAGLADERRGLDLEPTNVASLSTMMSGYSSAGMPDSAKDVARRLVAVTTNAGRLGMAAFVLGRNGARREADAIIHRLEALPEGTWTRSTGLTIAYFGTADTARAETYMERASMGDGDLFVLLSALADVGIPHDARTDAAWRRFHLDPARMSRPSSAPVR